MGLFSRTPVAPPAPALPSKPAAKMPAPTQDDAPAKMISETLPKGASGTINQRGFLIPDEYVRELQGKQALVVYDRIRNDGAVEEALGHMIEPVVAALTDLQIEPASEDKDDIYAAELCRIAMFEWLNQDWQEFCRQALEMLTFGHSVFEVTEQIVDAPLEIEIEQPDGADAVPETHSNHLWRVPSRFAPRLQRTIWMWHSKDGQLTSIVQQAFNDDGSFIEVEIPAEDLMVFTLRRSGDNYMGRSILRAAYKPWYLKDVVEKTMVVAIERHGVGVPTVYVDAALEQDAGFVDECETMLANLRSGEYSYLVWPRPKAGSGAQGGGLTFEIVSPPGGLPTGLVEVAEYFRGDIKAALLTRFSELGHASVGARSVGEVQTEVWHRSLEAVGALVCSVLRDRFASIVDDNLPGARTPTVKPGSLDAKSLGEFATAVSALVSGGAIEADHSLREWVRTEIGAPDEDEGTDQALKKEAEAGALIPPGGQPPKPGEQQALPGMPGNPEALPRVDPTQPPPQGVK